MATASAHINNYLNVNRLNAPAKRHRPGWIDTKTRYDVCKRPTRSRDTKTESMGLGEGIPHKQNY